MKLRYTIMTHDREPSDAEAARWQNFDRLLADYEVARRQQLRKQRWLYSTFIALVLTVSAGIVYFYHHRPPLAPALVRSVPPQLATAKLPEARVRLLPVSPALPPARRPEPAASLPSSPAEPTPKNTEGTGDFVEALPEGGYPALYDYFATQLRYPEAARRDGVAGAVLVGFTINAEGASENIRVIQGIREDLDQEAVRLIEQMPRWSPATLNGQPVTTQHTLPLTFQLTN